MCKKIAHRFTFDIYTVSDIEQEAFVIALEIIDKWDGRNLEHWLTVSLSNRLRNLIKKEGHYSDNKWIQSRKEGIMYASDIDEIPDNHLPFYEVEYDLDSKHIFEIVEENLPIEMRRNYLKMKSGEYLERHKAEAVLEKIREILKIEKIEPKVVEKINPQYRR